jgi:two-component sensor histidine kinase
MRSRSIHLSRQSADRSFVTMRRLLLENARLSSICAEQQKAAKRHDLLLREGDHRIKNSLQVVASLLGLQERREESTTAREALRAASARIRAVAAIHDALQLNGGNDDVNLGALLVTMCESLYVMAGDPTALNILVEADPIQAPLAIAQPIVLAVNELVINAIRHAFPGDRAGAVTVTMKEVGAELRIVVADNGVGLPDNYTAGRGYGMKLVAAMVTKAGGKLVAESASGARFSFSIPMSLMAATPRVSGRNPATNL